MELHTPFDMQTHDLHAVMTASLIMLPWRWAASPFSGPLSTCSASFPRHILQALQVTSYLHVPCEVVLSMSQARFVHASSK